MCACLWLCACLCKCQWGPDCWNSLKPDLHVLVRNLTQVLGTKLRPSARAICALNHWAISLAHKCVCVCVYTLSHNFKGCHSFTFCICVEHGVMGRVFRMARVSLFCIEGENGGESWGRLTVGRTHGGRDVEENEMTWVWDCTHSLHLDLLGWASSDSSVPRLVKPHTLIVERVIMERVHFHLWEIPGR